MHIVTLSRGHQGSKESTLHSCMHAQRTGMEQRQPQHINTISCGHNRDSITQSNKLNGVQLHGPACCSNSHVAICGAANVRHGCTELDFECNIVLMLDQQTANQEDSVLLAADELWLQRTIITHSVMTYALLTHQNGEQNIQQTGRSIGQRRSLQKPDAWQHQHLPAPAGRTKAPAAHWPHSHVSVPPQPSCCELQWLVRQGPCSAGFAGLAPLGCVPAATVHQDLVC